MICSVGRLKKKNTKQKKNDALALHRPVKCAEHFRAINYVLMICFGFRLWFPSSAFCALVSHSVAVLTWTGISICDEHACASPHAHMFHHHRNEMENCNNHNSEMPTFTQHHWLHPVWSENAKLRCDMWCATTTEHLFQIVYKLIVVRRFDVSLVCHSLAHQMLSDQHRQSNGRINLLSVVSIYFILKTARLIAK